MTANEWSSAGRWNECSFALAATSAHPQQRLVPLRPTQNLLRQLTHRGKPSDAMERRYRKAVRTNLIVRPALR